MRYLWNLIKSDNELSWEIREFSIIGKITPIQIHGIKNHWIWIRIHGEIEKEIGSQKYMKTKIKTKIKLIYDSKSKSNDKKR